MKFAHPYLFLLLVPGALAVLYHARVLARRRSALSFSKTRQLAEALRPADAFWMPIRKHLPEALAALAWALGVLALARPQKVLTQGFSPGAGIDILLVLDTSTSMKAMDFKEMNRFQAAILAAKEFISNRVADRIGVLVFGGVPVLACPPTLDYESLLGLLDQAEVGMTRSEGTAIGDAMAAAANHLKEGPGKSKVMILLTDGRSNAGYVDPLTAAKAAATFGIKVHAIGAGRRGQALYPVDDPLRGRMLVPIQEDLDEDSLQAVARETGGRYFRAADLKELKAVYAEIDRMEKTERRLPKFSLHRDLHAYFLWPALALLLLGLALSRTLLLRIP